MIYEAYSIVLTQDKNVVLCNYDMTKIAICITTDMRFYYS